MPHVIIKMYPGRTEEQKRGGGDEQPVPLRYPGLFFSGVNDLSPFLIYAVRRGREIVEANSYQIK